MLATLALVLCIAAGIVGGVFFAFSTFVMKALSQLPAPQGVLAMQRINVVVLNPWFLGVFFGAAVFAFLCVVAGFGLREDGASSLLSIAAGLVYLVGSFGVTLAFNVPRNEVLARMESQSAEAAAYWPTYVREWSFWNHIRTVASVVSAICAAAVLMG